jgi:phosphatidylinositol glycan class K
VYHAVKRFGIPDDRIILMLADNHACNPRNVYSAQIYHRPNVKVNLFGELGVEQSYVIFVSLSA